MKRILVGLFVMLCLLSGCQNKNSYTRCFFKEDIEKPIQAQIIQTNTEGKTENTEYVKNTHHENYVFDTCEPEAPLKNPIDFENWISKNSDIYAWIEIPGLGISYPVYQSTDTEENFYLHHDINRNYDFKGVIYTQKDNAKDFSDPVTLVYGHNMLDSTMFSYLVKLLDTETFQKVDTVNIYLPGKKLVYYIVAAFQFDKRHVLHSFDFSDANDYQRYLNYFTDPPTSLRQIREGREVSTEDRIVTLSTCLEHGASRLLIQCKLIAELETD